MKRLALMLLLACARGLAAQDAPPPPIAPIPAPVPPAPDVPAPPETPPKAEKPRAARKPKPDPKDEDSGEPPDLPTCADITRLIEHLDASDRPGVIARNAADHLRQALAPLRQFEVMTAS